MLKNIINKFKTKKLLVTAVVISLLSLFYILYTISKPTTLMQKPTSTYPENGSKPLLMFPSSAIVFYFDQPVVLELYRTKIDPKIEFQTRVGQDGKSIAISPTSTWNTEIPYTIYLLDAKGNEITKTTVTFLDPFKHKDLLDDHPPGGI